MLCVSCETLCVMLVMHGLCEYVQIVAGEYLTAEHYMSTAQVTVTVTSHSMPHFSNSSYWAVIGENSSRGTAVANVTVRV